MRSSDVVKVFDAVHVGVRVEIVDKPLRASIREHALLVASVASKG
jgi:hypothetical protein